MVQMVPHAYAPPITIGQLLAAPSTASPYPTAKESIIPPTLHSVSAMQDSTKQKTHVYLIVRATVSPTTSSQATAPVVALRMPSNTAGFALKTVQLFPTLTQVLPLTVQDSAHAELVTSTVITPVGRTVLWIQTVIQLISMYRLATVRPISFGTEISASLIALSSYIPKDLSQTSMISANVARVISGIKLSGFVWPIIAITRGSGWGLGLV